MISKVKIIKQQNYSFQKTPACRLQNIDNNHHHTLSEYYLK